MKSCSIIGCTRKCNRKSGYCNTHDMRVRRTGDAGKTKIRIVAKKGTGTINNKGYRIFKINGKQIREHRLIIENHLGRKLLPTENIHHINGDKADNRLENLEIWTTSQPSGKRPMDLIQYAKEILNQYDKQYFIGEIPEGDK